jgi:hypothetical protein
MRRVLLVTSAALVAAAACRDVVTQQNRPQPPQAPSASASAQAGAQGDASSLCAAYRGQLAQAKAALARAPGDAALQQNVDTYQAIINDACN